MFIHQKQQQRFSNRCKRKQKRESIQGQTGTDRSKRIKKQNRAK